MIVDTDYDRAASTGLLNTPNNPNLNPQGKPQWYEYVSVTNTIDFQCQGVYNQDLNDLMTYAFVYVVNITDGDIPGVRIGLGSDDSIQVKLNGEEIWLNNVARGCGGEGEIQDWTGWFTLPRGLNRLMVKVFEGWGATCFRLKFEDQEGKPLLTDRIEVRVTPYGPCPDNVEVYVDSWLREVIFTWDEFLYDARVYEGGREVGRLENLLDCFIRLQQIEPGQHRYEFRSWIDVDDSCPPFSFLVDVLPAWPVDFQCTYSEEEGAVHFSWRNREGYYEVLKILEDGRDVPGILYEEESAILPSPPPGEHTYALHVELAGYENEENSCTVQVAGAPQAFRRGDTNTDGSLDISDAIAILSFLFANAASPLCPDAADTNDDGGLDISDAVALLLYLFASGEIPDPGPIACGPDPTDDGLADCNYPPELCR